MAKLLNDDRTKPIYATSRFSDVLSYAEGKDFLRVLFDDEKHLFLYCNGWDYIHIFLGKAAIDCGLYPTSLYSKLTKNLGLYEFTISTKYRKELLTQDSYSSVKEYNGFFIYTREGSDLLKNPVFKEIVKPYIKKKEITIEQRIRRLEKKLEESISFTPTKDNFVIGEKDFQDEDCDVYYVNIDGKTVGMLALSDIGNGEINLEGLKIGEPYRRKGFGKQVVDELKKKYKRIYVRAIPDAKKFWDKQGHKSIWNNDSGTYDGDIINEREDLTKFNRIAGFYHLKTKQFELFPRTSEEISPEDDEVNDYIHNVHSKDEFTEFNIVRFGIEDIPGEGVICYIEGDTKRNVEQCYYAILEKYAEECDIIKYELEYYVGNKHKYIYLDRYGNQVI